MKIRLILERSNFDEANSPAFDWAKDYITTREEVLSIDVRTLTDKEINQIESDFYEKNIFLYPRNGIERIVNGDMQYLNLLILDYPLKKQWKQDEKLLDLTHYLTNKYNSLRKNNNAINNEVRDVEINNIIEIDSLGGVGPSEIEYIYNLLFKEGFEFEVIYEESSVYNVGATGGGIKLILSVFGHAANIIAVKEFFKKYYPYMDTEERISSYNIEMLKKDISKKYKVYGDQLTLESYKYNETDNQMEYVFQTRYNRFLVDVKDGRVINSSRTKI